MKDKDKGVAQEVSVQEQTKKREYILPILLAILGIFLSIIGILS